MTDLRPDSVAIRAGRADNGTALAPVLWGTSAFVTPSLAAAWVRERCSSSRISVLIKVPGWGGCIPMSLNF